jgi:hypothetical protein
MAKCHFLHTKKTFEERFKKRKYKKFFIPSFKLKNSNSKSIKSTGKKKIKGGKFCVKKISKKGIC